MDVPTKAILLLLILQFNGMYCSGNVVTFFGDTEYSSTLLQSEDSMECRNLPESMTGKVNSILTDGCTVIFGDLNCDPETILTINQGERKNLTDYWIQNGTRSFRRCSIDIEQKILVEVFRNSNVTGSLDNFTINHNECITVARRSWDITNETEVLSVRTSGCIQSFIDLNCTVRTSMNYIPELSQGNIIAAHETPFGVKSIQACEMFNGITFFTKNSTKEFLIYDHPGLSECGLLPDNFEINVGNVLSSNCVMLYASHNCDDDYYSLKVEPNKLVNLQIYDEFKNKGLIAYGGCSPQQQGEKAEIELYGLEKHNLIIGYFVAKDFPCCMDLSSNLTVKSVKNHGTCLEFYHETGCRNWGRTVFAGHTYASQFLRKSTPRENSTEDLPPFRSFKLCKL